MPIRILVFPRPTLLAALALVLAALPPAPARATEGTSTGFMAADAEMVQKLLRVRSRDDLLAELESARDRRSAAETELAEIQAMGPIVSSRVDIKRREIDLLKERVRLAKKEGNATKATELENERKKEEAQLLVFEAMRDAVASHLDRAKAAREFALTRIELQEVELKLVDRREKRTLLAASPADARRQEDLAKLDREISVSSRTVLDSIRDYARRGERLAKATEAMAKANLKLLEVWESYGGR